MSLSAMRPIASFLEEQRARPLLKCITCGSVDDGKSTLIGRILLESKNIFDDQIKELERDSARYGTRGGEVDLALLVDGLKAEREQGITIDVAYRFFSTDRRRFIIADTPGHPQYTRNMATAASTADVAIVLIDAEQGISEQTRLHTRILALMAVEHVVLAINKMDLVAFDEDVFVNLETAYRAFAAQFAFKTIQAVPISGVDGDNVATTSANMLWYDGAPLLGVLENIEPTRSAPSDALPFRLAVQWVNRSGPDFRGFCGVIDQGCLQVGDSVQIAPSRHRTTIRSIVRGFDEVSSAVAGEAVTITLDDEYDIGRGDILCGDKLLFQVADQFAVRLLWMNEKPLLPGRQYILKIHTKEVNVTVTSIKHREDISTGAHLAAKDLSVNEVGVVNILTSEPIVYDPYAQSKSFGGFILIDRQSFETLGAGMIDFALRRSANTHWQSLEIDKALRAAAKNQKPQCFWFTGLSGSGKSTLANLLEKRLAAEGKHTYLLDGDNVRHGLNRDLGFSEADRIENIRRVAEVSRLMVDAGLIVIVSFISPFTSDREMARSLFGVGEFVEIFVDTPIEVCESRDVKGLYAKARRGELVNFTGIDSAYEVPLKPDVVVSTTHKTPDECIDYLLSLVPLE